MGRRFFGLARAVMLGGSLACGMAGAAAAQLSTPFGPDSKARMTDEDYKLWGDAVTKLLDETPAKAGSTQSWSNPASGNHGVFTILKLYTMNNMPCRKVNSLVTYNPELGYAPRSLTLGACQTANGEWKVTD